MDKLIEMIAKEGCEAYFVDTWENQDDATKECWRQSAKAMLSVIRQNVHLVAQICPTCKKRGYAERCSECKGHGVVPVKENILNTERICPELLAGLNAMSTRKESPCQTK